MVIFVTQLFSAIYTRKDCNRESSAIHIRKTAEFLFPEGEWRDEKNSSQLGRTITRLSDDILCEMSYSPARTHIVINRFLQPLIRVIQNEVKMSNHRCALAEKKAIIR